MFDLPPNSQKTELICLNAREVEELLDKLVEKIKAANAIENDPWVKKEEAMRLLRINSEETLSKFCKEGTIQRSKTTEKHLLYNRASIFAFIEKHIEK
ncbi:MAG: hypothetical protein EPGJADBJ_01090 [Saprospiraceae bacterium]|nr:hypothetical protein [Saprospiraceae bacterium]